MGEIRPCPALVLGGGITGLAAALALRRAGVECALLEAGAAPGGVMGGEQRDGFIFERGPDSFLAAKTAASDLCRELGLASDLLPRSAAAAAGKPSVWIWRQGRLHPLPAGWRLNGPGQLRPVLRSSLLSPAGKGSLLLARLRNGRRRAPDKDDGDESAAAWLRARCGRQALDRIARPLLAGVFGGQAEELSARVLFAGRASPETAATGREPAPTAAPLFTTLRGGMGALPAAAAGALGEAFIPNQRALSLRRSAEGEFRVTTDTAEWRAPRVIVALPAPAAATLLRELDSELAALLARIPYADAATVSLAYDREPDLPPGTGLLVGDPRTPESALACTFAHRKFAGRAPAGAGLLRWFYGGDAARRDEAALIARAREDARALLGVAAAPRAAAAARLPASMPRFRVGHADLAAAIEGAAARVSGLALAGNYFLGLGVGDCIACGRRAAARIAPAPALARGDAP